MLRNGEPWHTSPSSLFSKKFKCMLAPAFDLELIVVHGKPSSKVSQMFDATGRRYYSSKEEVHIIRKLGTRRALNP